MIGIRIKDNMADTPLTMDEAQAQADASNGVVSLSPSGDIVVISKEQAREAQFQEIERGDVTPDTTPTPAPEPSPEPPTPPAPTPAVRPARP